MRLNNIYSLALLAGIAITGCTPEQEVEPVDSPADNPVVTITPAGDYSSVAEGDLLTFDITVDKMIQSPLVFDVELANGSTADEDDFEATSGTLAAFSTSTSVEVLVTRDADADEGETLAFSIVPNFNWEWQINPESGRASVSAPVKDLTYYLDWSEGSFAGESLCDSAKVDLDLFALNADGSAGDFNGATGSCPEEAGNLGLPDDTYDIYVQLYDSDFPADANTTIPYVVTFPNGATIEGSFSSSDPDETTHLIGQVVIAGDSYTLYDENGAELGSL